MKDSDAARHSGQAPVPNPASSYDPIPASIMTRWIHPTVLLVATDLSDLDRLMPFAFEQAAQTGARLLLLHVVSASASYSADLAGMPYYDPAGALQYAAKELDPVCATARRLNIPCEALLREGSPADQIGAVARQFKADRVLLGTRSRSKLGKLLLGSVAEQVLRSVNLPVITVGPEAHLTVDASPGEPVVLLATTLREASRPSAALACHIAASQGARLVLLHVLQPDTHRYNVMPLPFLPPSGVAVPSEFLVEQPDSASQSASFDSLVLQELGDLAAEAATACGVEPDCASRIQIEPRVVHGNPSIEILAQASERHASLIVLGARSHSLFENITRDRTIYRVLAHARCPVLTLRESEPAHSDQHAASLTAHG